MTSVHSLSHVENPPQLFWQMRVFHLKDSDVSSAPNEDDWRILYIFEETERFQKDVDSANFYVSQFPYGTIFYKCLLMHKNFWIDEEDGGKDEDARIRQDAIGRQRHIGTIALFGAQLTRNTGSNREEIKEIKTEEERVQAIKEYFGFDLENAIEHIRGRPAALPC